jgi:CBS domain-containing protein
VKVRDVMTTDVVTVGPYTPFQDIVALLLEHDISGIPVLNGDVLVGIITEADLVAREAKPGRRRRPLAIFAGMLAADARPEHQDTGFTAYSLMTSDPVTIGPDDDVRTAAATMMKARVKRLPVVEDGKLVGIVTRQDLLRFYSRSDEEIAADVNALLESSHLTPDVRATIEHGVVILEGSTEDQKHRDALPSMLDTVPGVVSVVNLTGVGSSGEQETG